MIAPQSVCLIVKKSVPLCMSLDSTTNPDRTSSLDIFPEPQAGSRIGVKGM